MIKSAINFFLSLSLFFHQQAFVLFGLAAISVAVDARRVRVRTRPVVQPEAAAEETTSASEVEDSQSQGAIQYYSAEPQNQKGRVLLLAAEDDYNGPYGQPQIRQRADYNVPSSGTRHTQQTQHAPRTKESTPKEPPVQTIRNYSNVNDDGSFTFGYEAADGSFKEETRGTDCVVRGKYGYVDPDGNKREFTYVSGNPCDPNNPEGEEPEPEETEENLPQNQNYPKRIVPQQQQQRPAPRPAIQTTTRPATTVFANNYNPYNAGGSAEEEEEENVPQYIAPRPVRPLVRNQPTTPASVRYSPLTITPRPAQSQPPATTYRPSIAVTQKPVTFQAYPSTTPAASPVRRPIDFASEFQKFQDENPRPSAGGVKSAQSGGNAIYQSQLVFDPSTGQYDSNLYQQLPKDGGDFELNQRIQPYVAPAQPQYSSAPQLLTLDQLRQQPSYARPAIQSYGQTRPPQISIPQFSQQTYQKSQENLQVLNSQQLFAQQTQLAHQQLHADRIKAAERQIGGPSSAGQRFQYQPIQTRPPTMPQAYYFVPQHQQQQGGSGSLGQIDAFLKGQNVEY